MNRMRPFIFAGVFMFAIGARPAGAGSFGLGLIIGEPSGVSFKNWIDGRKSFEGIVGFGFGRGGSLSFGMDWTYHWSEMTPVRNGRFLLGLGGGGLVGMGNNFNLGLRGKGVADYTFADAPVNIFLEIAPTLFMVDPDLSVTGGIGFRWFF